MNPSHFDGFDGQPFSAKKFTPVEAPLCAGGGKRCQVECNTVFPSWNGSAPTTNGTGGQGHELPEPNDNVISADNHSEVLSCSTPMAICVTTCLLQELLIHQAAIKQQLDIILRQLAPPSKPWYSVEEFAVRVGKEPYTVREWCRERRIRAAKQGSGRGKHRAWVVSHDELLRYERDGLLPNSISTATKPR